MERPRVRVRGGCSPRFVIDGMLLAHPVTIDDLLPAVEVEALEVYHRAAVPVSYAEQTACGVVTLWTRDPGDGGGKVPLLEAGARRPQLGRPGLLWTRLNPCEVLLVGRVTGSTPGVAIIGHGALPCLREGAVFPLPVDFGPRTPYCASCRA